MRRALSLCLAAALVTTIAAGAPACKTPPLEAGAEPSAVGSASVAPPPASASATPARAALVDAYRGTIDPDLPIALRLERKGGALDGSYFYETRGADIALHGTSSADGSISLTETTGGKPTGTFKLALGDAGAGDLSGTWTGTQGGPHAVHLDPIERHAGGPAVILKKWHRSHRRPKSPPLPGARILQCNLDAAYPEIFGLGDAKIEAAINDKLRAAPLTPFRDECDAPYIANAGYAVHQNRAGVLSVSFTYDSACEQCEHGSLGGAVVDVLVDTGAALPLEALLVHGGRTKLIPMLSKHLAARIKGTPGATGEDVLTLRNAYLSGDYVLEDEGLRLIAVFRLPHASQALDGDFGVLLPWAQLTDVLDPQSPAAGVWRR